MKDLEKHKLDLLKFSIEKLSISDLQILLKQSETKLNSSNNNEHFKLRLIRDCIKDEYNIRINSFLNIFEEND